MAITTTNHRRSGRIPTLSLLLLVLLSIVGNANSEEAAAAAADDATAASKSHSTVIDLTNDIFDAELSNPANGLWFLKFYAPWCGHCKQLAPTLDKIAPYLQGKMAIGKIDCTKEKKLCERFNVKGYPTLKFFRDGDYWDYPGKRDADSIIEFAEKMAAHAVTVVSTYDEALESVASRGPDGVGFVAYDPDATGSTVDELVLSTKYLQVFQQAARKMQAEGTFGLLKPDAAEGEAAKFGFTTGGSFMAKIERDVDSKFYKPPHEMNTPDLLKYVKEHNVALVTTLGPHNFRSLGERMMPVAIAVTDPENEAKTDALVKELTKFAKSGTPTTRYRYMYAKMDGRKWGRFLSQFSIEEENIPELFVLNIQDKKYWQNSSVTGVEEFLAAVADGTIEEREQKTASGGPLKKLERAFLEYMPWSLYGIIALIVAGAVWVVWFIEPVTIGTVAAGTEESKKEK